VELILQIVMKSGHENVWVQVWAKGCVGMTLFMQCDEVHVGDISGVTITWN